MIRVMKINVWKYASFQVEHEFYRFELIFWLEEAKYIPGAISLVLQYVQMNLRHQYCVLWQII